MNENVLEWNTNQRNATLTISQQKYKNRLYELKERFPDDVDIRENVDGSILAHIPQKWIKINPPRKLSEEYKEELARRAKNTMKQL